MKKYILMTCVSFFLIEAVAQNCSQKLNDATRSYYNGKFREVSAALEGCLVQLSREEKTEAYKLLVNTYLVLGETEVADKYLHDLLMVNPDFKPRQSDLVEFKNLFDSYEIISRYSFGFSLGPMRPDYRIIQHQSYASVSSQPDDYKESMGFFLGLTGNVLIVNNFYLNASILYDQRSFKQKEIIMDIHSVTSKEKEYRFNIPLQVQYIYRLRQFQPFVTAGYSYHYLVKATGDIQHFTLEPELNQNNIGIPYAQDNYDLTPLRSRSTWNWIVGVGAQINVHRGYLLALGFSYERGLNNLTNPEKRYSDPVLTEDFAYVPDDYKVSSWMLSISIMRNYSKPKKK